MSSKDGGAAYCVFVTYKFLVENRNKICYNIYTKKERKIKMIKRLFGIGLAIIIAVTVIGCEKHDEKDKYEDKEPAKLSAMWFDDINTSDYDEIKEIEAVDGSKIAFFTDKTISDFKIYSLEFVDFDKSDNPIFVSTELHSVDVVNPSNTVVVSMVLAGTIPNNGISYVDEDGTVRCYTVNISGKDGSVILSEYAPGF